MMTTKRVFAVLLAVLLTAGMLAGCGNDTNTTPEEPVSMTEEAPPTETDSTEPVDAPPIEGAPISGNSVIDVIAGTYSTKEFKNGQVSSGDLEQILLSGSRAPSARNLQPWRFSVVTDTEKVRSLINQAPEGGVAIIISGLADAGDGMNVDFDCGLATMNMYLAASSLGLGTHIYMGGVDAINESRRDEMGIPDGYDARMLLLIAYEADGVDAVSSASTREDLSQIVTYID